MVFLFIWIGVAVLCAVVAKSKNRSVIGWLILGLIFGIFALIILLFLGDPTRVQTIVINNQVAAVQGVPVAPVPVAPAPAPREPLLVEPPRSQRRDGVAEAKRLEAAVIGLRALAESAGAVDERAIDQLLGYIERENGDYQLTRKEADQLVKWMDALPRDEATIRRAVADLGGVVGDRDAFLEAVDRLEGRSPNDRQVKWAEFLRARV